MLTILAGGWDGDNVLDTILEYDITGDSYTEIGTMKDTRESHAVSVVQHEDFAQSCQ